MTPYNPALKPLARQLRSNMTDAERSLWQRLRRDQVNGVRFNRQKPLAGYIVDFYCAAAGLVIELDGSQHLEADSMEYDAIRTDVLTSPGFKVLRFDNRQVLLNIDHVMAVIFDTVQGNFPQ